MSITRREFAKSIARTTATGFALTVLGQIGCDEKSIFTPNKKRSLKANLATEPFRIGPISQYAQPGVYDHYKKSHGVWIVRENASNDTDDKTLVVLSATCTHAGCSINWNDSDDQFQCPCHKSGFTRQGINLPEARAPRPLERCTVQKIYDPNSTDANADGYVIQVDPTVRFRRDKDQWDNPASLLLL